MVNMKKLTVSIYSSELCDYLLVDGKNLSFVKDKESKRFIATYETDKDAIHVSLDQYHVYLQDGWWIKNMLIWAISFFGIFSYRHIPNYIYNYKAQIPMNGDVSIECKWAMNFDKAIEISGAEVKESANERLKDSKIKKRKAGLGWSKFGFIALFIGLLALILPKLLG